MIQYKAIVSTINGGKRYEVLAGLVAVPESVTSDGDSYTPEDERALAERWARDRYDGITGYHFERVERV